MLSASNYTSQPRDWSEPEPNCWSARTIRSTRGWTSYARSPVPWIHIAEEVVSEAQRRGVKRLAILGTRFLMEGPVYPSKLTAAGIGYRIPDAWQRERINQIIYGELVYARMLPESLAYFQQVIRELAADGCDGVALACTDIPLLINQAASP